MTKSIIIAALLLLVSNVYSQTPNKVSNIGDTLTFNSWDIDLKQGEVITDIAELTLRDAPLNQKVVIVKGAKIGEFSIYQEGYSEWKGNFVDTFEVTNLFELVDIHLDSDGDIDYDRIGEETKSEHDFGEPYNLYFPIDELTDLIKKNSTIKVTNKYWDEVGQNIKISSKTVLAGEENYRFLSHGKIILPSAYKIKKTTTLYIVTDENGTFYNGSNSRSVYVIPNDGNTVEITCRCEKIVKLESNYLVNKNLSDPLIFDQESYFKMTVTSISSDARCKSVCVPFEKNEAPYYRKRLKKIK